MRADPVNIERSGVRKAGGLQQALGLAFGMAVAVGGTVGVGILRRPGTIAQLLPHVWAIFAIWIAGGVYAMLGALCVAELSTMIPRAGGFFVFTHRAFGPAASFAIGWCDWLANTASVAYGSIASAELLPRFAPVLEGRVQPIAIVLAAVFCAAQCVGVRASGRLQKLLSFLVCIAFAGLVAGCFALHLSGSEPPIPVAKPMLLGSWVLAFRAVIVSYDGWYEPAYFSEESVNPGRTVPRSLVYGVLLVMSIYLLVNAGLLHALGLSNLQGAELPVADAARRIAGGWGDSLVVGLSLLALLPMANAGLLGGARIFYGFRPRLSSLARSDSRERRRNPVGSNGGDGGPGGRVDCYRNVRRSACDGRRFHGDPLLLGLCVAHGFAPPRAGNATAFQALRLSLDPAALVDDRCAVFRCDYYERHYFDTGRARIARH